MTNIQNICSGSFGVNCFGKLGLIQKELTGKTTITSLGLSTTNSNTWKVAIEAAGADLASPTWGGFATICDFGAGFTDVTLVDPTKHYGAGALISNNVYGLYVHDSEVHFLSENGCKTYPFADILPRLASDEDASFVFFEIT